MDLSFDTPVMIFKIFLLWINRLCQQPISVISTLAFLVCYTFIFVEVLFCTVWIAEVVSGSDLQHLTVDLHSADLIEELLFQMCKRYPGFLRVAIADPQPERRWFRRGWVTFERQVNIKEICWNLNNIRVS